MKTTRGNKRERFAVASWKLDSKHWNTLAIIKTADDLTSEEFLDGNVAVGKGKARDFEGNSSVLPPTTCVQLQDMVRLSGRKQHVKYKSPDPSGSSSLVVIGGRNASESGSGSGTCGPTPRERWFVFVDDTITEESESPGPFQRKFLLEERL